MNVLTILSIVLGVGSLLSMTALHIVSPEFQPSWRMISEYATGKYKWLITLFFYTWGTSSMLLALSLLQVVDGFWAYLGVSLLALSGVGAICGGIFDINHKKHGMSFVLGVPTLPVAALILSYHLLSENVITNSTVLIAAHATWISLVLMAISMMVMFSGFKKYGIVWDKDAPTPTEAPKGVIALGGYANRLLVFCYIFWVLFVAVLIKSA
jgi:Protein of unknown function (DUF998)